MSISRRTARSSFTTHASSGLKVSCRSESTRSIAREGRRTGSSRRAHMRQRSSEKLRRNGVNDRSRQMPNETHLKRLISDAVFDAYNTHGGKAAGDRFYISREDSRIIAGAVFDALRRANVLLIDQPGQPNPETAA